MFFMWFLLLTFGLSARSPKAELKKIYNQHTLEPSDIFEHLPVLKELASECPRVVEIGLRAMVSSWGILCGLAENRSKNRSYFGIDLISPDRTKLDLAERMARKNGINFTFLRANDMDVELNEIDFLFIDSLHTYCHLTYELEKFSSKVRKYIAMHDTGEPWGIEDDTAYSGNYTEYPAWIDRNKRGLRAAIEDFLKRHFEWIVYKCSTNNHGFTVLKRILY